MKEHLMKIDDLNAKFFLDKYTKEQIIERHLEKARKATNMMLVMLLIIELFWGLLFSIFV